MSDLKRDEHAKIIKDRDTLSESIEYYGLLADGKRHYFYFKSSLSEEKKGNISEKVKTKIVEVYRKKGIMVFALEDYKPKKNPSDKNSELILAGYTAKLHRLFWPPTAAMSSTGSVYIKKGTPLLGPNNLRVPTNTDMYVPCGYGFKMFTLGYGWHFL